MAYANVNHKCNYDMNFVNYGWGTGEREIMERQREHRDITRE